jgi:hypothetical protein
MDDDVLRAAFKAHKDEAIANGEKVFSRRRVIAIADFAGMRPMSMVWKLEKLNLLKRGSFAWFKENGGITAEHVWEARADRAAEHKQQS